MRCHEAIRLMPLFLDSELSPEVTLEVEEHFESCPECRARLENERRLEDSMRATLFEPDAGDSATWNQAVARAVRIGRRPSMPAARSLALVAAAVLVAVFATVILWLPHRELDLARSAAKDHARFVTEVGEEALAPATMRAFLEVGSRTLPPGSTVPTTLPSNYELLKTGQCELDGAPVAYLVIGQHGELISVFLMPRAELRRFPAFAMKLGREKNGVACQIRGRHFFGASTEDVVACAVGRASDAELRRLVRWALSS